MQKLYIYGCGGVGNELAEHFMNSREYEGLGFIDDNPDIRECMGMRSRTLDELLAEESPENVKVIISIGEPAIREAVSEKVAAKGIEEIVVDLSDHCNPRFADIGSGTLLHAGSYISVNTQIGKCCMINKGALVGHDCVIGDYTVLSPRVVLGGNVTVGEGSYIGIGASVRNGITIGKNVIIGMGSVVVRDVEDDAIVVGNPAKFLRKNESRRVFKRD